MKLSTSGIIVVFPLLLLPSCEPKQEPAKAIPSYSIEQFYKNTQIRGGAFSPDESRLLVSSNESGIYNVYEITITDGARRQVTQSTAESFFAVDYVPGTDHILYSADKGGNEISHIYLLSKNGSTKDLTPSPNEKANFLGWSLDKKSCYYLFQQARPKILRPL